jgi:hypothetical protein
MSEEETRMMRMTLTNAGNTRARHKPVMEIVTFDSASLLWYHIRRSNGVYCAEKFGSLSERLVIFMKGRGVFMRECHGFYSLWRSPVCVSLRAYQSPQMKIIRGNALLCNAKNGGKR